MDRNDALQPGLLFIEEGNLLVMIEIPRVENAHVFAPMLSEQAYARSKEMGLRRGGKLRNGLAVRLIGAQFPRRWAAGIKNPPL
jgi:hypothetical protein